MRFQIVDDGRLEEPSLLCFGVCRRLAARARSNASALGLSDVALDLVALLARGDRPDVRVAQSVSERELSCALGESFEKCLVDALFDDEP